MRSMVGGHVSGEAMRAPVLSFKRARKLRRNMSLPEVILWEHLRRGELAGMRFRRQHPGLTCWTSTARRRGWRSRSTGRHTTCRRRCVMIFARDAWLAGQGVRMLRIAASDVLEDRALEGVLVMIAEARKSSGG
jgi:very-short-patch-repair endonuclease